MARAFRSWVRVPPRPLIFNIGIMEGFKKRREDILNVFSNAQKDLEQLNAEIDAKIADNNATISSLNQANKDLASLKANNETSIKTFTKFFK